MFKIFKNRIGESRGFTLIELMVVISIIALLSSIVLASLKTARDKAQQKAFRQQMNQFIIALELYKADYGQYPHENQGATIDKAFFYNRKMDNSTAMYNAHTGATFHTEIKNYISKTPEMINPVAGSGTLSYQYYTNSGSAQPGNSLKKCFNDINIPSYVIIVYIDATNYNKNVVEAVSDWETGYYIDNGDGRGWQQSLLYKCFSIK